MWSDLILQIVVGKWSNMMLIFRKKEGFDPNYR